MGVPEQVKQLQEQVAELQAWKESVEKVWQKIVEDANEPG